MSTFFLLAALFSAGCLVVGLIRPASFDRYFKGHATRKSASMAFGGAAIGFFILFGVTVPPVDPNTVKNPSSSNEASKMAPTSAPQQDVTKSAETAPTAPAAIVANPQEELDKQLSGIVGSKTTGTKVSYVGLKVEKSDPDRPKDTQSITVSVNVGDFYNKDSFIKDTGVLSTEIFQAVYGSKLNHYDVFVWYYGATTDRYGNQSNSVIQTYAIDKVTFEKINWQNFDRKKTCDFLKQEGSIAADPASSNDACNTLVNIK